METIKLSQEACDMLDTIIDADCWREVVSLVAVNEPLAYTKYDTLREIGIESLMEALVIGYDVEKSPDDKIRHYFDENSPYKSENRAEESLCIGRHQGALTVLEILGIEVEGVTHK